jgi:hypothetical protein
MLKSQLPLLLSLIHSSHENESSDTAAPQGGHLGMPPPTLLTLPRELRDMIYSYLHGDVVAFKHWKCPPKDHDRSWAYGKIHNLPLLSPLLVCAQIHDEYAQTGLENLSATIDFQPRVRACKKKTLNDNCRKYKRSMVTCVMRKMRHVTLLWSNNYINMPGWGSVLYFATRLRTIAMDLKTLRVLARFPRVAYSIATPDSELCSAGSVQAYCARTSSILESPLPSLSDFTLITRGKGNQVRHDDSTRWAASDPLNVFHKIFVVGVHTYALSQRPNPPSILNFCPMREYPDTALELLGEARRKEVAS